jgi:hypothetical protein
MAATIEKTPTHTSTDIKPDSPLASPLTTEEGRQKNIGTILTHDEYHLATLGYRQEFIRSLGFFESWAATFTSMNFASGIPVLFGWVMVRYIPGLSKSRGHGAGSERLVPTKPIVLQR